MDIQKFIQDNIPNVEARGEFDEYKTKAGQRKNKNKPYGKDIKDKK